ncbi:MAG: hypothetical protein KDC79_16775 [Cyclobacteriaceae bacterium]|nr:hypothetical protein [Cyclobacteriaceae bacterium]
MKKVALWVLAVVITLAAVIYQRMTGPTYPKRARVELNGKEYKLKLIRSHGGTSDAPVELNLDPGFKATLYYKFFPNLENEEWEAIDFKQMEEKLVADLPNQPPAGKLMYYIDVATSKGIVSIFKEDPVVIRFKGDVPALILIPHIFLMFFSMMLANVAGLFAIAGIERYKIYTNLTFIFLLLGGMILGPIVQLYAFGDLWTGVPFGWDLTDNKTLIAFLFWLAAVAGNRKKQRPYLTILAAVVGLLVYSIPHSMFGSELDRASGVVTQGMIQFFYLF